MNLQSELTLQPEFMPPPFDLSLDEDQKLVSDMVGRFAEKNLEPDGPDPDAVSEDYARLGLEDLFSEFSDPVLITLVLERLGYGCVLGGLRLVLPHMMASGWSGKPVANLCITNSAESSIGVTGLIAEPDHDIVPLLIRRDVLGSFAVQDLFDCSLTPVDRRIRGFRVLKGSLPYGKYRELDDPIANWPSATERITLALMSLLIGGMFRALDFGYEYAQSRVAFGKAIIGHQPVSFRLVDGLMKAESLRLLVWREATRFPNSHGLKGLAEEVVGASATVQRDVMQNCGGHGYVAGSEINTLFQTNSLCRALLSSLSNDFLKFPSLEEIQCSPSA